MNMRHYIEVFKKFFRGDGKAQRWLVKGIGWKEAREKAEQDFGILFPENILKD